MSEPDDSPSADTPPIILCVDDDPVARQVASGVLQGQGFTVHTAGDGEEALPMMDILEPDLILLDMQMPNMDGMDVLAAIRRHPVLYNRPVIVVSGVQDEESITGAMNLGAVDYLDKPIRPGVLAAKVKVALRNHRFGALTNRGFAIGKLFNRRFELISELGSGGFSTVYRARDTHAQPPADVALKIWRVDVGHDAGSTEIQLFLREAYNHSRLEHPNIVRLIDFGQTEGIYFMATEFLAGETLQARIDRQGPISESLAILIALNVVDALRYLEQNHLVHRDVKPENLMMTKDGRVVLLDFGLARRETDQTVSPKGEFSGSPDFVSPEHVRGDETMDIRADIYSLGATLFYALTGEPLYQCASIMQKLWSHLKEKPRSLQRVNPAVSPGFSLLVADMLRRFPDQRPDVDALEARLQAMAADLTMPLLGEDTLPPGTTYADLGLDPREGPNTRIRAINRAVTAAEAADPAAPDAVTDDRDAATRIIPPPDA